MVHINDFPNYFLMYKKKKVYQKDLSDHLPKNEVNPFVKVL